MWNEVTRARGTVGLSSISNTQEDLPMVYVGIDVSKDKHDCYIATSEGEVLTDVFTVPNSTEGFKLLFQRIKSVYSYQILLRLVLGQFRLYLFYRYCFLRPFCSLHYRS